MNFDTLRSEIKSIASHIDATVQNEIHKFIDDSLLRVEEAVTLHAGSPDMPRILKNLELQVSTDAAIALVRLDAAAAQAVNRTIVATIRTVAVALATA